MPANKSGDAKENPKIRKAMQLYGMEFGFSFLTVDGDIAKFKSDYAMLIKLPVSHCLRGLKERGYGSDILGEIVSQQNPPRLGE